MVEHEEDKRGKYKGNDIKGYIRGRLSVRDINLKCERIAEVSSATEVNSEVKYRGMIIGPAEVELGMVITVKPIAETINRRGDIVEISMDATFETNQQHLELYCMMTEVDGVGFPLSYCLLSTVNATIPGKRKRALEGWAEQAKAKYHLAPCHISVDKDLGEISTCQTVWPNAKVSICWWHQRKAVRERLEKSKLSTTPYDARAAREIFPVINLRFLPPGRSDPGELEGGREGGGRDMDIQSHLSLTIPSASQPKPFDIPLSQRPLNEIKTSPRVFCPPELREAIIAKMDSHRHAHPLIPGCAEPSPEGICGVTGIDLRDGGFGAGLPHLRYQGLFP